MPRKTRVQTRAKKAQSQKRAKKSYKKLMNLSLEVVPHIKFARLRYASNDAMSINNSFQTQNKFSLNGLYDPDISGIGHQPYGFDQMMSLYNTYVVLGAKIKILARPGSTSNTYPMNLYCEMSELSSIQYTNEIANEKPGIKKLTFNSSASNVYNPERRQTLWWSAKKWFRAKDRQELINQDEYTGNSTSNPNHQAFLYITYQAQDLQQTTAVLYTDVVIDYIVAFINPKQLLSS